MKVIKIVVVKVVVIAIVIITTLLLHFVNGFFGNPISRSLAKIGAGRYICEKYPQLDLNVERVGYNFKSGRYFAFVQSRTSEDTAFLVHLDSLGHALDDNYDKEVRGHLTTWRRLSRELYTKSGERIKNSLDYDFESVSVGFIGGDQNRENRLKLQLDMRLDIHNPPLPLEADVYVYAEDVSYDTIAEVAKAVEAALKEQGVPIIRYSVTLIPLSDKSARGHWPITLYNALSVSNFPAERMSEDSLSQAMEQFEQRHKQTRKELLSILGQG